MKKQHVGAAVGAAMLAAAVGAVGVHVMNGPDRLERVIDGDTLVINHTTHVRLWGIDAPEFEQHCIRDNGALKIRWACGGVAKGYLQSMLALKVELRCEKRNTDKYGRVVAICYTINTRGQKHDIAKSLVAAGYAVDWPQYSNGYYGNDQDYAKQHKLGIWSGEFEMPWDWRAKRGPQ